jgi:hypothetical protein
MLVSYEILLNGKNFVTLEKKPADQKKVKNSVN